MRDDISRSRATNIVFFSDIGIPPRLFSCFDVKGYHSHPRKGQESQKSAKAISGPSTNFFCHGCVSEHMNAGALDGLVPKAWKPAPMTPLHAPLHAPLVATSVPIVAPIQPMMSPMPMSPVPMPPGAKGSWKDVAIAIMQLPLLCRRMDEISIQIQIRSF